MGSVTGVVYFDFGKLQFPVAGWNDFVVVVANWWIAALEEVLHGPEQVKLRFMDGPYWIVVSPQENSNLLLRCADDRQETRIVHEAFVRTSDLRSEIATFAHELLQACSKENVRKTDDLEQLKKRLLN
jgi:hypothetical protein